MRRLLTLTALLLTLAGTAQAGAISLTTNNLGLTGTFGLVQYDLLTPTTASVLFTALPSGGDGTLFGGQGAVALNLQSAATVSDLTGTNTLPGFTSGPLAVAGPGNEDGFGSFNLTIDSFDGYTHSSQFISFTLTKTTGTWANEGQILALNGIGGWNAAAHIFRCASSPCLVMESAVATGYAAGDGSPNPPPPSDDPGNDPSPVPEPSTWLLLTTGLLGLGWKAVRRS